MVGNAWLVVVEISSAALARGGVSIQAFVRSSQTIGSPQTSAGGPSRMDADGGDCSLLSVLRHALIW